MSSPEPARRTTRTESRGPWPAGVRAGPGRVRAAGAASEAATLVPRLIADGPRPGPAAVLRTEARSRGRSAMWRWTAPPRTVVTGEPWGPRIGLCPLRVLGDRPANVRRSRSAPTPPTAVDDGGGPTSADGRPGPGRTVAAHALGAVPLPERVDRDRTPLIPRRARRAHPVHRPLHRCAATTVIQPRTLTWPQPVGGARSHAVLRRGFHRRCPDTEPAPGQGARQSGHQQGVLLPE